jgi:hypothetical protein
MSSKTLFSRFWLWILFLARYVSSKFQLTKFWFDFTSNKPGFYNSNVDQPSFLSSNTNSVLRHVLIKQISASHVAIIFGNHRRFLNLNNFFISLGSNVEHLQLLQFHGMLMLHWRFCYPSMRPSSLLICESNYPLTLRFIYFLWGNGQFLGMWFSLIVPVAPYPPSLRWYWIP